MRLEALSRKPIISQIIPELIRNLNTLLCRKISDLKRPYARRNAIFRIYPDIDCDVRWFGKHNREHRSAKCKWLNHDYTETLIDMRAGVFSNTSPLGRTIKIARVLVFWLKYCSREANI